MIVVSNEIESDASSFSYLREFNPDNCSEQKLNYVVTQSGATKDEDP